MFDREGDHCKWRSPLSHLQSWVRIERLQWEGRFDLFRLLWEEKKTKGLYGPWKICYSKPAAVGSLISAYNKCCPSSPVIPHSVTSSYTLTHFSPQAFFPLLSPPQDADNHAHSQAQRMYHISIFWSSWCIHSFFLCFLNSSLYLLTEQRCTSWYIAPR